MDGPPWRLDPRCEGLSSAEHERAADVLRRKRAGRLFEMALEEDQTDLTFVFDDGGTWCGHRSVMCVASDFLTKCMAAGMAETRAREVRVRECSREAFVAFAEFCYTGSVSAERAKAVDARELLLLCQLWEVEGLREWLLRSVTTDNVCAALKLAAAVDDEELCEHICASQWARQQVQASGVTEGALQGLSCEAARALMSGLRECGAEGHGRHLHDLAERWWRANSETAQEGEVRVLGRAVGVGEWMSKDLRSLQQAASRDALQILYGDVVQRTLEERGGGGVGWGRYSDFVVEGRFGSPSEGAGVVLPRPIGVGVLRDGRVCVLDGEMLDVGVCDAAGRVSTWLQAWVGEPYAICVQEVGGVEMMYISDSKQHRVAVYTEEQTLVRRIGKYGREDGQMCFPQGVAVSNEGEVFVCDSGNERVQVFNSVGSFQRILWKEDEEDRHLYAIALHSCSSSDGSPLAIVSDGRRTRDEHETAHLGAGRVVVLHAQLGHVLKVISCWFVSVPRSLVVSVGGDVVVSDDAEQALHFLDWRLPEGQERVNTVYPSGRGRGRNLPLSLALLGDGGVLVTDCEECCLRVIRPSSQTVGDW